MIGGKGAEEQGPELSDSLISMYALVCFGLCYFPICCVHICSILYPFCGLCH